MAQLPTPWEGILLTHFIVSRDVDRSQRFYTEVLGRETVFHGTRPRESPRLWLLQTGG
jgi:catechol 2,3-dioxygenase-like lactoylglutathione lyase family enzyme